VEAGFDLAALVGFLDALDAEHGDGGLLLFVRELRAGLQTMLAHLPADREPTPAELRREVERRLEQERQRRARSRFDVAAVCSHCGKVRRGRRWLKQPIPEGYVVEETLCPGCEAK
jgi:hypothetical protein